jgi:serine/threonine protein kinase
MIGKTILHYKIIEKLGEGGMGVVYKAEDTKLDRTVAIKFLPRPVTANPEERKRFVIEAKAAAALNHPNIATIHAIEEADGEIFIVMEYIDGHELKNIVGALHAEPLPIDDIINYATQIAEGLQAAHKKGIVHRDIKSSNIMITRDGKVKIMDFGLAKVGQGIQLTREKSTLGTAAYMSPEQAHGDEVDYRSDIWSFGVVLYEMLVGKLPFRGDYEQAMIYSILNEEPELPEYIPAGFDSIILKALAKKPEERFQSATEIITDIMKLKNETDSNSFTRSSRIKRPMQKQSKKWVVPAVILSLVIILIAGYFYINNKFKGGTVTNERKMIVVLPFENLGAPDDEYFADGITGEITSKLSGLSGLGVIARSSAMQYKNTEKSLKQIGEELGVGYVLEGTVQWEKLSDGKKRIRVNPELVNVENSTQMWSKPYEAEFSSAFTLQSEIAATVAEALNLKLVKSEQKSLESNITNNSAAYDNYLKAKYYSQDITSEKNSRIAEELLENAIKLDSSFAAAYAALSTVQSNMYWSYFERTKENLRRSKVNAQKALLINPDLAEAHVAMGDYFYHGILEYESALQEYKKAISLNPNLVDSYNGIAFVLRRQGKMRNAIEYLEKTYELDPRDYVTVFSIGETYNLLREYEKSIPYFDKANLLAPEAIPPYDTKARNYLLAAGDTKKARSIIQNARERKIGLDSYVFSVSLYYCDILNRNFNAALNQIKGVKETDDQYYYKPEDLYLAEAYWFMKNNTLAEKHFLAAKRILKEKIKQNPEDSRLYTSLGIACAGLGEKQTAIQEGKHGYELLPITREAWRGSFRLFDLAQIYTMVGEQDLAIQALDELLSRATDAISVALLKIDPTWDPLRENPKFQELLQNYSKEIM